MSCFFTGCTRVCLYRHEILISWLRSCWVDCRCEGIVLVQQFISEHKWSSCSTVQSWGGQYFVFQVYWKHRCTTIPHESEKSPIFFLLPLMTVQKQRYFVTVTFSEILASQSQTPAPCPNQPWAQAVKPAGVVGCPQHHDSQVTSTLVLSYATFPPVYPY